MNDLPCIGAVAIACFVLGFILGGLRTGRSEPPAQEGQPQEETIIIRKEDAPHQKQVTVQMYLGDYFHLCRVFSFLNRAQMRFVFVRIIERGGEFVERDFYPATMTQLQAKTVGEQLVANGLMAPRTSRTAALKWDTKGTPTGESLVRMMVERIPETSNRSTTAANRAGGPVPRMRPNE